MAIMIPSECDLTQRPMSERKVFQIIKKNLSDEWKVFHSFDYLTRSYNNKRLDGEIDFLLYHPVKGFLVIEVKGGTISYRDGQWYQENRRIDPVVQAKRNKYAVLKLLQEKLRQSVPLKFAHAVCFPSCGRQEVWPIEAKDIVLTEPDLPYIESFASQILEDAPIPDNLQGTVSEKEIMRILSPLFEYGTKLSERIAQEEKRFFLFTEQQYAILDALEQFKRVQVRGCAGSGKTVMALKKAEKLASQGKSVLLLCFNQLLAEHLRKSVKDYPTVKVAAFFEYCIELLQLTEEETNSYRDNPKLYSEILPDLLKEYLDKTSLCYDSIIVDEGQDFTSEAWDIIARFPKNDGEFYIFYDPDQNIFRQELVLPDFNMPPLVLNRNCRNTKKIFDILKPYQTVQAEIMEDSPEGSDVHILVGDSRNNLAAELKRLYLQEKVPLKDIVILGAHSLANTDLGKNPRVGVYQIVSREVKEGSLEVAYYTYMKYKGCEAKVVILYDVTDSDPRWKNKQGIYTAMSRAVHQLIILKKELRST